MAMTNRVKVTICGTEYTLTTDEPAGYIQELAAEVDASIRNLMNDDERVSLLMAAIMTALVKSNDAKKASDTADNLRSQMKDYLDDANRNRMAADTARRDLERLRRENEELKRRS